MKDSSKTFLFFIFAFIVMLPAVLLTRSEKAVQFNTENMLNQTLFPGLKGVMDVATLSISHIDKAGSPNRIEVKKVNGEWILTNFSGYPANAQNRMVEVVSELTDIEVLRIMGNDVTVHAQCGVIDPDETSEAQNAEPDDLGTKIVIRNATGQTLLDMILGRETEEGSGKYYVRRTSQNPVYVIELNPSKLSVKFLDWIETDLLKVQPSEVASLFALDCSLNLGTGDETPEFNHRGQFTLNQHYMETPDWTLTSNLKVFGNGMREMGMPTGKTLDYSMLRRVCQALSDMRICSVQRKSPELAIAFQHPGNMELVPEQNRILQERGFCFLPMNLGNGTVNTLFSSDGQVHVYTQDGLVFRLYFGGIAGQEAIEDIETLGERKFYRYLVLTADMYPAGIPQPNLQEIPPKPDDNADSVTIAQYEAQVQMLVEVNQQEQKIYDEKLAEARKKAEQLNTLFASWFFIVPEEVYQQIHLTYDNVFISEEEAMKRSERENSEVHEEHIHDAEHCDDPNCPEHQKQK